MSESEILPRETGSQKSGKECAECGRDLPMVTTNYGSFVSGACSSCTEGDQLEAQKAAADERDDEPAEPGASVSAPVDKPAEPAEERRKR